MIDHKRILVALSLADGPDAAFERALVLAKTWGAALYLLHAVPATQPLSYRAAERLQRATEFRARAKAAGVSADAVEQHGDPAEIVVLHADARQVDLIVMGTERQTWWTRLRDGSLAERVLRRTKRPTLVVRGDDTGRRTAFDKVLVAVDMSPASTGLIDVAREWAGGANRPLTVVHAVDAMDATSAVRSRARWIVSERGEYVLDVSQQFANVVAPAAGSSDRVLVAAGRPVDMIVACADEADADLIVMGGSRRSMHLGSTAVRVLRQTNRPLLIVPPVAAEQTTGLDPSAYKRAA